MQAGARILVKGKEHICKGNENYGNYVIWHEGVNPKTGKPIVRRARPDKVTVLSTPGGWIKL